MRIIKSFVTAAVFLLALESLTSAEMTGMSLQERMRQSDVVVVGEILESHNTGKETEYGTEHWLAICQLKQIFKENFTKKIPSDGFNIYISFIQVPMRTVPPIKLTEGKKYLLFLKDTGSQKEGQIVYEMITDIHGAFEAGQEYFVHDEQSPEYPKAVKMSFDEIVQRVTQKNPASVDIRQQPERELSEDELRMKERLIALSQGEGTVEDLQIELSDGGMALGRFYRIAYGQIVGQEWDMPGSLLKHHDMFVTDEEVRQLLRQLIEHEYWTFSGTQFYPDATEFGFRFQYKALQPIKYSCQAHEYEPSAQLSAIRSLWLDFVSGVSMASKTGKPKG